VSNSKSLFSADGWLRDNSIFKKNNNIEQTIDVNRHERNQPEDQNLIAGHSIKKY
jgi:hypothetical protein